MGARGHGFNTSHLGSHKTHGFVDLDTNSAKSDKPTNAWGWHLGVPESYRRCEFRLLMRYHAEIWLVLIVAKYCRCRQAKGRPVENVHVAVDEGLFEEGAVPLPAAKRAFENFTVAANFRQL